jgi:hypothetical protein
MIARHALTAILQKVLPIIFSPGNRVYYGVGASLGHAFAVGKEI